MTKYPSDYNPIIEYWNEIKSGCEVVPIKIRKTYKYLNHKLADNNSEFFYSSARGNHIIEFIENFCKHSKGRLWRKTRNSRTMGKSNVGHNIWIY